MAWRGLHLTQPSRLSFADDQVVVAQEDGEVRLALEDVAWIVIDSPRSTFTVRLMSACMNAGIAVIFTDETHTPSGMALPFHRHHRQAEMARIQAQASAPLQKRLWQTIIRRKVENQAANLDGVGQGGALTLRTMATRVRSGDAGAIEAQAARYYWSKLWPAFRRDDDGDRRNKLINYGYAVARGAVARSLVAAGLLPCFGLHHASVTNAFNLADDMLEPFRPFVDALAWSTVGSGAPSREDLSIDDRRAMAGVLLADAAMGVESVTLLLAAERATASLARAFEAKSHAVLELPAWPIPRTP